MKLISSLLLLASAQSINAEFTNEQLMMLRKGGNNSLKKYVINSPTFSQMSFLSLKHSLMKTALGIPDHQELDNSIAQNDALNHIEVQLKNAFWLIHDYTDLKKDTIMEAWDDFTEKIIGYGCHCFVHGLYLGGAGKAQDRIDLACREYSRCIKCIDVDRVNGDAFNDRPQERCTPHSPYYTKQKISGGERTVQCGRGADEGGRQSECQIANCRCDMELIQNLAKEWKHYNADHHSVYVHGIGDFNNGDCVNEMNVVGPPDGCCLSYPERRAYWKDKGKDCCGKSESIYTFRIQNLFQSDEQYCHSKHSGEVRDRNDDQV